MLTNRGVVQKRLLMGRDRNYKRGRIRFLVIRETDKTQRILGGFVGVTTSLVG